MISCILDSCPVREDDVTALFHVRNQGVVERWIRQEIERNDDQFITREIITWEDDVGCDLLTNRSTIEADELRPEIKRITVWLVCPRPDVFLIEIDTDFRVVTARVDLIAIRIQFRHDLLDFFEFPFRFAIMIDDAVTEFLCSEMSSAEPEVNDCFRSPRDCLVRPKANMTWSWQVTDFTPALCATQLFHDPEAFSLLRRAAKIVITCHLLEPVRLR